MGRAAPRWERAIEASRGRISILLVAFLLVWIAGSDAASVPSRDTLGIAPQDEDYYKPSVIKCKDGSKKFTRVQLNDEFCDCPDGTDEPGTSACPEGRFYCRNKGHTPMSIFSSRVNDGICDCCDGSDEYDGKVKCSNTCWGAGKLAREKLKKKVAIYKEGVVLRKIEVEKAKKAFEQDEAELSKLESEEEILKGLLQRLKDHKEQIEKAEEEERLKKEKEEEKLKEAEKKKEHDKQSEVPRHDAEDVHESFDTLNLDVAKSSDKSTEDENAPNVMNETPVSLDKEQYVEEENNNHADKTESAEDAKHVDPSSHHAEKEDQEDPVNTEGLSKEELGRLVASRWTGERISHHIKEDDKSKQESQDNSDTAESSEEEYDGYNSESEDDSQESDDNEAEDDQTDDEYEDNIYPSDSYKHEPEDDTEISEAARFRKEYDDLSSKLSKIQSRISKLTKKLKHDFGGDKEFYSFYDHCFETKQNKYVYKICPFKEATQVEGHSTARLGKWDKFEESYRLMQFSNGDRCWNGPDRSLKVRLVCGLKNEVTDVDEPSRCEYSAILLTPVLCLEEKMQELQEKLELMNSGESLSHDEL